MRPVRRAMSPRRYSSVVLPFLGLLFSSCASDSRRLGRFVRSVQSAIEIAAMTCGAFFALIFIGGATVALVKNMRSPSAGSKRWGVALGTANLALGLLFVAGAVTSPPRDPVVAVQAAPEVVEMVDPSGVRIETPVETAAAPVASQHSGDIDWIDLGVLIALGLAYAGFGLAGVLVAMRATMPTPAA